ncbi:hypothetical protein BaRGS_00025785 [Batillaria attramentaria]|uniref:Uncharacterized protein n=1 Tax=Batillaria attramentaria TaxID=370345 RepID=A0ABD0K7N3_9CAEN
MPCSDVHHVVRVLMQPHGSMFGFTHERVTKDGIFPLLLSVLCRWNAAKLGELNPARSGAGGRLSQWGRWKVGTAAFGGGGSDWGLGEQGRGPVQGWVDLLR